MSHDSEKYRQSIWRQHNVTEPNVTESRNRKNRISLQKQSF